MTTLYVRKTGSDANAGTSAGAAYLTIGKALSVVASGDQVWVGAGVYRESLTLSTSMAAETKITGDVDGAKTGDAGEVQWSAYTTDNRTTPAGFCVKINNKNFYTFENIHFVAGSASAIDAFTVTGGTNITFTDCAIVGNTQANLVLVGCLADTAMNWTFTRCHILALNPSGVPGFNIQIPTTATAADYDVNFVINNCWIMAGYGVLVTGTGAQAHFGGGVKIRSCLLLPTAGTFSGVQTTPAAKLSTTFPCTVYDSWLFGSATGLNAGTAGQLVEDYNLIQTQTARNNVTAGVHSVVSINGYAPLLHFGQERIWGGQTRPFGAPTRDSPALGFGASSSPLATDMRNVARPEGEIVALAAGTATAGANTTLTDSGAAFPQNGNFRGAQIKIVSGTGAGQIKTIKSNTATVITVYGNWTTNPDNTSVYRVYMGAPAETFTCTSGSTTTAVQSTASWPTNYWAGFIIEVTAGTGSGQTTTITSNTGTTLTIAAVGTGLDSTSVVAIYRKTSINTVNQAAGALERADTAVREATTVDASTYSAMIAGAGYQDLRIPVDAASTVITVRTQYDSEHGTGTKPQASILANGEIGVTAQTVTAVGAAATWETLTFSAIVPTAKGVVTLRIFGRATNADGKSFFDSVTVV